MELQFDKEIDAILRRARGTEAVTSAANGSHLDADTINAFVENALPDRVRRLYFEHFADCGRCRKLLSSSIGLNTAAVSAADIAAESVGGATAVATQIPWYSKLFRTPGLALGMGALVIVFTGVLGYVVLQNRAGSAPTVSQLKPEDIHSGAPAYNTSSAANSANSTNTAEANSAMVPAATPLPAEPSIDGGHVGGPSSVGGNTGAGGGSTPISTDTITPGSQPSGQPLAGAPPPPPMTAAKPMERDKSGDISAVRPADDKDEAYKMKTMTDEARRDLPAAASKTGPSRAGPVQTQSNNVNQQLGEMTVTRGVGGKTFSNRDGAWYDNAYHGQSTTNVRRGTEEFNKLDKGLRSIANQIGGVVVVVWGSKAYRIN